MSTESPERPRSKWRTRIPAPLRHGILLFLVVLVIEYLVVPELIGASHNLALLEATEHRLAHRRGRVRSGLALRLRAC